MPERSSLATSISFLISLLISATTAVPASRLTRMVRETDLGNETSSRLQELPLPSNCMLDGVSYSPGAPVPGGSLCETCQCRPPGVLCEKIRCDKKPGCLVVQQPGQCCPQYQCECTLGGRTYANSQRLDTGNPCVACYCQGGHVVCTEVSCYKREDCEPRSVPGQCCPQYDHCPPLEKLSDSKPTEATQQTVAKIDPEFVEPWPVSTNATSSDDVLVIKNLSNENTLSMSHETNDSATEINSLDKDSQDTGSHMQRDNPNSSSDEASESDSNQSTVDSYDVTQKLHSGELNQSAGVVDDISSNAEVNGSRDIQFDSVEGVYSVVTSEKEHFQSNESDINPHSNSTERDSISEENSETATLQNKLPLEPLQSKPIGSTSENDEERNDQESQEVQKSGQTDNNIMEEKTNYSTKELNSSGPSKTSQNPIFDSGIKIKEITPVINTQIRIKEVLPSQSTAINKLDDAESDNSNPELPLKETTKTVREIQNITEDEAIDNQEKQPDHTAEKSGNEVYHEPSVLRIGDQLIFLNDEAGSEKGAISTPKTVITVIGAEGLQRGGVEDDELEEDEPKEKSENVDVNSVEKELSDRSIDIEKQTLSPNTTVTELIYNSNEAAITTRYYEEKLSTEANDFKTEESNMVSSFTENIKSSQSTISDNVIESTTVTKNIPAHESKIQEIGNENGADVSAVKHDEEAPILEHNPEYPPLPEDLINTDDVLETKDEILIVTSTSSPFTDITSEATKPDERLTTVAPSFMNNVPSRDDSSGIEHNVTFLSKEDTSEFKEIDAKSNKDSDENASKILPEILIFKSNITGSHNRTDLSTLAPVEWLKIPSTEKSHASTSSKSSEDNSNTTGPTSDTDISFNNENILKEHKLPKVYNDSSSEKDLSKEGNAHPSKTVDETASSGEISNSSQSVIPIKEGVFKTQYFSDETLSTPILSLETASVEKNNSSQISGDDVAIKTQYFSEESKSTTPLNSLEDNPHFLQESLVSENVAESELRENINVSVGITPIISLETSSVEKNNSSQINGDDVAIKTQYFSEESKSTTPLNSQEDKPHFLQESLVSENVAESELKEDINVSVGITEEVSTQQNILNIAAALPEFILKDKYPSDYESTTEVTWPTIESTETSAETLDDVIRSEIAPISTITTTEGNVDHYVSTVDQDTTDSEYIQDNSRKFDVEERAPGEPFLIPEWERTTTEASTTLIVNEEYNSSAGTTEQELPNNSSQKHSSVNDNDISTNNSAKVRGTETEENVINRLTVIGVVASQDIVNTTENNSLVKIMNSDSAEDSVEEPTLPEDTENVFLVEPTSSELLGNISTVEQSYMKENETLSIVEPTNSEDIKSELLELSTSSELPETVPTVGSKRIDSVFPEDMLAVENPNSGDSGATSTIEPSSSERTESILASEASPSSSNVLERLQENKSNLSEITTDSSTNSNFRWDDFITENSQSNSSSEELTMGSTSLKNNDSSETTEPTTQRTTENEVELMGISNENASVENQFSGTTPSSSEVETFSPSSPEQTEDLLFGESGIDSSVIRALRDFFKNQYRHYDPEPAAA